MLPKYLVKFFYFIWKEKESFGPANSIISKTKLRLISNTKVPIIHPSDKWLLSASWARRTGSGLWGIETKPSMSAGNSWRLWTTFRSQPCFAYSIRDGPHNVKKNKPFLPILKTPKISTKMITSVLQGRKKKDISGHTGLEQKQWVL